MKSTVQIYVLNSYNDESEKIHTHLHPLYIYIYIYKGWVYIYIDSVIPYKKPVSRLSIIPIL